jgi:hypothetical protein
VIARGSGSPDRERCPRLLLVLAAGVFTASCAAPLLKLPSGPGTPAPDGASALAEATSACGRVSSLVAEGAVSGSADRRRVRGTLHLGVAAPASARLEAIAPFGQPIFLFVAQSGEATLLLTRPDRVLRHDQPGEVLEAITGIPLDPAGLRTTLTGCAEVPAAGDVRRLDDRWRMVSGDAARLYLQRDEATAPWRLVAVVYRGPGRPEWRVEYHDFVDALPRTLRFVSSERERFDLRIELSQVEIDTLLGPEVFELKIPASAAPLTLDELRQAGPLAGRMAAEERQGAHDAP